MKQLKLILTIVVLTTFRSYGQVSDYTDFLTGTKQLSDIANLKTANDFDQNNLSIEQIDNKIENLIRNSKDYDNFYLDIPINSKLLTYIGKKHPKDLLKFTSDAFTLRLGHINKELEIYNYDGIYVFLQANDNKNLLNLFFTLRALTIIKVKYPEAYNTLLKQQQGANATSYVAQDPYRKTPSFNKCNSIISFDSSPQKIAASTADMVYATERGIFIDGYGYNENTINLITSIDNEMIFGNIGSRSQEIYGSTNPNENYFHYMKDGLIETIIHEFIHNYITSNSTIDKKAFFIAEMRLDATDKLFQNDVEEAIVLNTSLRYCKLKGGISTSVIKFYEEKLKGKEIILTSYFSNKINLQRYYALKALSDPTAINFEDIYILNILKK